MARPEVAGEHSADRRLGKDEAEKHIVGMDLRWGAILPPG
jgi:hypothetical protein